MIQSFTVQFDLFPEGVSIEERDPRLVAGAGTRLTSMFIVKFERENGVHQVFVDHHGTYCADHGRECRAVAEVIAYGKRGRERRGAT